MTAGRSLSILIILTMMVYDHDMWWNTLNSHDWCAFPLPSLKRGWKMRFFMPLSWKILFPSYTHSRRKWNQTLNEINEHLTWWNIHQQCGNDDIHDHQIVMQPFCSRSAGQTKADFFWKSAFFLTVMIGMIRSANQQEHYLKHIHASRVTLPSFTII